MPLILKYTDDKVANIKILALKWILVDDWVVLLRGDEQIGRLGDPPDLDWLTAFLAGAEHLDGVEDAAPSDLAWANLLTPS